MGTPWVRKRLVVALTATTGAVATIIGTVAGIATVTVALRVGAVAAVVLCVVVIGFVEIGVVSTATAHNRANQAQRCKSTFATAFTFVTQFVHLFLQKDRRTS